MIRKPMLVYDAEYHVGIRADDDSDRAAADNSARLNDLLAAGKVNGSFPFVAPDFPAGPATHDVYFDRKTYFFKNPIITPDRVGLIGILGNSGASCYAYGQNQYSKQGSMYRGGKVTRFIWKNAGDCRSLFQVHGHGFNIHGIQLFARPYLIESGNGPIGGSCAPIGIEICGGGGVASGGHSFSDMTLLDCKKAIAATRSDGEDHADNCHITKVNFCDAENCLYLDNQQAVCYNINSCRVTGFGNAHDTIFVNAFRGGNIWTRGLDINVPKFTLLQTSWFSSNQCEFDFQNIKFDHFEWKNASSTQWYFKPFVYDPYFEPNYEHSVPIGSKLDWVSWRVRCTGQFPNFERDVPVSFEFNDSKAAVGINRKDLLFDVKGLPTANMTLRGDGPWWYPNG